MSAQWAAPKDPDELKDYRLVWSAMLTNGDALASSTWSITDGAGLTIQSQTFSSAEAVVWLEGGTAGTDYRLMNEVTTTGGRTYQQSVKLKCRSK